MIRTMLGTQIDSARKYPDRIALMVRWLKHNEDLICQFETGGLEFHFAGHEVFGRISKANLHKPEAPLDKRDT